MILLIGAMVAAGGTYTVCHSSFDGDLDFM